MAQSALGVVYLLADCRRSDGLGKSSEPPGVMNPPCEHAHVDIVCRILRSSTAASTR